MEIYPETIFSRILSAWSMLHLGPEEVIILKIWLSMGQIRVLSMFKIVCLLEISFKLRVLLSEGKSLLIYDSLLTLKSTL